MKQILALFLGLLLVFSLAACSKTEADPSGTANNESGQSTTPSENDAFLDETPVTKPPTKTIYFWTQKKVTDGKTSSVYTREYDTKGNLLTDSYRTQNNSAGYTYTYTYDEKGNCLSESFADQSGGNWNIIYTYDDGGKLTTKTTQNAEGSATIEYFYGENGKLIKDVQVHSADSQTVTEYTYSRKGFLLKEETYNIRGDVSEKTDSKEYVYDIHGNVAVYSVYKGDELLDKQRWIYDNDGKLTAEIYNIFGEYGKGMSYTYDKWGKIHMEVTGSFRNEEMQVIEFYDVLGYNGHKQVSERIRYNTDESVISEYEYTYDAHGNLTTETVYHCNDNKVSVTEYTYIAIEVPND